MKKLAGTFIGVLFLFSTSHARTDHDGYLVKFKREVSLNNLKILSDVGVNIQVRFPQINVIKADVNPLKMNLSIADRFILASMIEYVEPNFKAKAVFDDRDLVLYNHKLINAPAAWQITTGSKDVVVAISDTGIWSHPDLTDNFWMNPGEVGLDAQGKDKSKNKVDDDGNGYVDDTLGWNFVTNTKNPRDDHFHGTHVAGIVGAGDNKIGILGVNWKVSLMAVKFLDSDGSGTYEGGIGTILYASDNGAKVINCSWGGDGYSKALREAIEYAKSKNVLVVAAAGNDSTDADKTPLYPAGYDNENIISVASIDDSKGNLSGFSNWGPKSVAIGAPGNNIYSTFNPQYSPLHRNYYLELSGTSMATPHVAGVVGLIYSVNPNLKWNEVKDIIMSTGLKAPKLKGKILSESIVDAAAAVAKAKEY